MNHAVTVDGYDSTASIPYFMVRNSWGPDWGLGGYINIAMSSDKGLCGMNQDVDYPLNVAAWP